MTVRLRVILLNPTVKVENQREKNIVYSFPLNTPTTTEKIVQRTAQNRYYLLNTYKI